MIRDWVRLVQPDTLLSWPVFFVTLTWVTLGRLLLGSPVSLRSFVTQIPLILVVHVMTFAFLWLVIRLLRALRLRGTALSVTLLLTIPVAGALYGAALTLGVWWTGLVTEPDVVVRAGVSATAVGLPLLLATIAVGNLKAYLSVSADLQQQQTRLLTLREKAQEQLQRTHEELVAAVRDQLRAELHPLPSESPTAGSVLNVLRVTIDDVVRPLSHRLAESEPPAVEVAVHTDPPKIDVGQTLRDAADPAFLRPVPITAITIFMMAPTFLMIARPPLGVIYLCIGVLFDWLVLVLLRDLGTRLTRGRPWLLKAAVFLGVLVLYGLALTSAWRHLLPVVRHGDMPVLGGMNALDYFRYQNFVIFVFVGFLVAVYYAARQQALRRAEELDATDRDLRWEISRGRELGRQRRAELANVLHGQVQSTLTAAYLRIEQEAANGTLTDEVLNDVRTQIEASIDLLGVHTGTPDPLDDVVGLVRDTWSGVAEIEFHCTPSAATALAADPSCRQSINDLIPELCFNAIKHADADRLVITIDVRDARLVQVSVSNNGIPPDGATRQGLGHLLLDTTSVWWRREHHNGWTTTMCALPCSTGYFLPTPQT